MTISSCLYYICLYSRLGLLGLALGSLMSCQSSPPIGNGSRPPSSIPTPVLPPKTPLIATQSKPITFSLNVENPTDLKIKQGEFIRKGQMIADVSKQRLDLATRQQTLQSELNALSTQGAVSFSLQTEQANIASAQAQYDAAQAALRNYEQNSPWTDFARDNLPLAEEEVELTGLQKTLKQTQQKLARAKATLAKKQLAIGNFQAGQASTKARIQQELLTVEQKIAALKPIQSRYTGTIAKIDLAKTTDSGPLKVTVKLIPGDAPQLLPGKLPELSTGEPNGTLPNGTLPNEALPNETLPNETLPNGTSTGSASDLVLPPVDSLTPETPSSNPSGNPTVE